MTPELDILEENAVQALGKHNDLAVAYSIYDNVVKALGDLKGPDAIIFGLEAVVRAVREAARREAVKELTIPGVQ